MAAVGSTASAGHNRQWFIVGRWQEYDGESRANLLRIIGIGAFYVIELMNYYGVSLGPLQIPQTVDDQFHRAVTGLAVAWSLLALGTLLCLRQRIFPAALKFITTGSDVVLLTTILMVADGPRSPLVISYFLIIILATLRFSLHLMWCATIGSIVGYLWLLGYARWFTARDITVPQYAELIFLLGLALAGIVLGQVIRAVRIMAEDFSRRVVAPRTMP